MSRRASIALGGGTTDGLNEIFFGREIRQVRRAPTGRPTNFVHIFIEEHSLAHPDLGTKRICQACQARYYDFNREPRVCPKCHVPFDPEAGLKSRGDTFIKKQGGRAKSVFGVATPLGIVEGGQNPEIEELEAVEDEEIVDADEDADTEDAIEDISELGDDAEDITGIGNLPPE